MPVLDGPKYEEGFTDMDMLFRRYKYLRGITLAVKGSVVTQLVYPYNGVYFDGSYDVIYEGGHIHTITQAEADVLIAAGYADYITPD
ncbi:hypothetical protein [Longispora urticae]